jgi:hypothetical protein
MDGCWKTGSLVRLNALDRTFRVVGHDSVGSIICEPLDGALNSRIYVPPGLLIEITEPDRSRTQVMPVANS